MEERRVSSPISIAQILAELGLRGRIVRFRDPGEGVHDRGLVQTLGLEGRLGIIRELALDQEGGALIVVRPISSEREKAVVLPSRHLALVEISERGAALLRTIVPDWEREDRCGGEVGWKVRPAPLPGSSARPIEEGIQAMVKGLEMVQGSCEGEGGLEMAPGEVKVGALYRLTKSGAETIRKLLPKSSEGGRYEAGTDVRVTSVGLGATRFEFGDGMQHSLFNTEFRKAFERVAELEEPRKALAKKRL